MGYLKQVLTIKTNKIMKTFNVTLTSILAISEREIMCALPDYFSAEDVSHILNRHIYKYHVSVKETRFDDPNKKTIRSMEKLLKTIEKVKLYREQEVVKRDKVSEIKEIMLPSDMVISIKHEFRDNSRHLTFFECSKVLPCTTCPYAEEGINKYLIKDIGATISCIGRYYLVGDYELVKRPGESIIKDGKNLDSYYLIKWEHTTIKKLIEI